MVTTTHAPTIELPYDPQQTTALSRLLTVRLRRLKLDLDLADRRNAPHQTIDGLHRRHDALAQFNTTLAHADVTDSLTITHTVDNEEQAEYLRDELFQLYQHVRPNDAETVRDASLSELAALVLGYAHRYDTDAKPVSVPE